MTPSKQTRSGRKAVSTTGAAVRPSSDVVTQKEMQIVLDAQRAVDTLCKAIQRRVNAGAAVEVGRLHANQEHAIPQCATRKDVKYWGFEIYPRREAVFFAL